MTRKKKVPKRAKLRESIDHLARNSPARLVLMVFAGIIFVMTLLLCLPISTTTGKPAPLVDALFTATSAVCVTGLTVVNTASYWSFFGQIVIMLGIHIGGLGVMTLASILALAVSRHIGLTQRMLAAIEKTASLGKVGALIRTVIVTSFTCEGIIFIALLPRFLTLNESVGSAIWHALFQSISIFNNAGLINLPEGIDAHMGDWWMVTPVILGTFLGALGFPVMLDLKENWRSPHKLSLHSKLTITTYLAVWLFTAVVIACSEWNNQGTFGSMTTSESLQTSILFGVNSRSSGISTIDVGQMTRGSWFLLDVLMFIGGGSASTAGGIKVSTLAVMILAIMAEARGDRDVEAFHRRIPPSVVRLSVAVTGLGAIMVVTAVFFLLSVTDYSMDVIGFEVISAFATVGLSTGITPDLPVIGKYSLVILMFAGRTGTMTVAAALALRERRRVIRMPEERPIIG
ncbi:TrkH family potassium uptake protein [uncultured Varibaculum sp.]|uniref:TrkH family potassium uptake protein n=1 Tax=uncultured Varibaculum sp. TaxID=413896 RepID=UPI0025989A87|nr:potassium transporter TrkG [uncultured Varibaculum sp.]